jgi:hypothetical protein
MLHCRGVPLALALAAACVLCARADFAFASFSLEDAPESELRLVGVANRTGDRLRLTPPQSGTAGALWCAFCEQDAHCGRVLRRGLSYFAFYLRRADVHARSRRAALSGTRSRSR